MKNEIIRYLNGEMDGDELIDFENRLDTDETLAEEFSGFVTKVSFKQELKHKWMAETGNTGRGRIIPFHRISIIAAVIVVLLVPSAFIAYYLSSSSSLINDYYMDYPVTGSHRGVDATGGKQNILSGAYEAFKKSNFEEATVLFKKQCNNPGLAVESNLYAGISLLRAKKEKDTHEALQHFNIVMATDNNRNDAAEWYKALALYELDEKETARDVFKKIANSPHHFRKQKAIEVLKEYY